MTEDPDHPPWFGPAGEPPLHRGLRGNKEDVAFRFRSGDGVCPVPETINLQPVETVEPIEHGKAVRESTHSRTAFNPAGLGKGGIWITPETAPTILSAPTGTATSTWLVREDWITT